MVATLTLLMFAGTVLSPQFLIWPIALGAAALCHRQGAHVFWMMALLAPIALMSRVVFHHFELEVPPGLVILVTRNLLLLVLGVELFFALRDKSQEVRTDERSSFA
jgi:hypothetical protein